MTLLPFALMALLLFYIQSLLARIAPMAPDLGPVLAAYLGLFVRRDLVPLGAALLGVLRASLDPDPVGVLILIHLALALFATTMRELVYTDRMSTQLVVAFTCAALYVVMRGVADVLFATALGPGDVFRYTVVAVLATLLAPFLFAGLRTLRIGPLEA